MPQYLKSGLMRLLMILFTFIVPILMWRFFAEDLKQKVVRRPVMEFLSDSSLMGGITEEGYQQLMESLNKIGFSGEIKLTHVCYTETPYYAYGSDYDTREHYALSNVRYKKEVMTEAPIVTVTETTSLLGDWENTFYVDLRPGMPTDEAPDTGYHAVYPMQDVLRFEKIAGVIASADGSEYTICDDVFAETSGIVELKKDGVSTGISVDVTVWDDKVQCENGHFYPISKEAVADYRNSGVWRYCPYCEQIPKKIVVHKGSYEKTLGEAFGNDYFFSVYYWDGHTEIITPDTPGFVWDYDETYCGMQDVSISYKGITVTGLKVTNIGGSCVKCGNVCEERSLADYSACSLCDTCLQSQMVFSGDTYVEEATYGTEKILAVLLASGEYPLSYGDFLRVDVTVQEAGMLPWLPKVQKYAYSYGMRVTGKTQ